MKIRHYLEYITVKLLLGITRLLPQSSVFVLFRGLGLLGYYLLSRRRITGMLNAEVVFPAMENKARAKLIRGHFLHMAESLALNTLIMSGRISNDELLDMVHAEHWDRLSNAIQNSPDGVLIFSGHIGNWELMAQYTAMRLGVNCHIIARETNNPLLEKHILLPLRERFGIRIFYKKNAMRSMLQAARKHEPAGIMIDQKLNLREGIPVEFFGRTAGTTATPAILQLRFGLVTIPVFMICVGRKRYRMIIGEPIPWEDNGKPFREQVAALTAVHQQTIEEVVLKYPEQWFWVHDRWGIWKARKKK